MKAKISFIINSVKTLCGTSKIPFLALTIVCVFLSYSAASHDGLPVKIIPLIIIITGALAAHIAVNVLNEYFDFKSGLDFKTEKTPFSGGSGSLQKRPDLSTWTLLFGILNAAIATGISIYFLYMRGWIILVPAIAGILLMICYTPHIVRMPVLCLCAPGTGFGFSMVTGCYIALVGQISVTVIAASIISFFLVNNLLLLNQFPDCTADREFGRKNIVILTGKNIALRVYQLFMMGTILSIIISVILKIFPSVTLAAIIPVLISLFTINYSRFRNLDETKKALGINVFTVLSSPSLVAAGLIFN
jgi:1,4-dihydroxy-2-naphthoate octaprenyltransferase